MSSLVAARICSPGPKRMLALDGGGVRGIVTIAFLERMEAELRTATGRPDLTLGQHFDLIGGTSVGSIIATMLALDWPMRDVAATFKAWCPEIFSRPRWFGFARTRFKASALTSKLDAVLGYMRLDDPRLKTMLAIVTKRLDTGSAWWVVANNPRSLWWNGERPGQKNHAFRVADLIRASTAAPTIFEPHILPIGPGEVGVFVDGGISPFNNPSLALVMMARLKGHGLEWPLGADRLKLISIGTGFWREPVQYDFWSRRVAAWFGVKALRGMIADNQMLSLAMLQWMSEPRVAWPINAEIGALSGECLMQEAAGQRELMSFQRYDVVLEAADLAPMMSDGRRPSERQLKHLRSLDDPGEMEMLYQIARKAAEAQVRAADFL